MTASTTTRTDPVVRLTKICILIMPWLLLNATSVAAADKDMSPEHAACIDKSNGVTDETKIKTLTGGDKITARYMKQDFFDFVPTFKLFICGNHKLLDMGPPRRRFPVAADLQGWQRHLLHRRKTAACEGRFSRDRARARGVTASFRAQIALMHVDYFFAHPRGAARRGAADRGYYCEGA